MGSSAIDEMAEYGHSALPFSLKGNNCRKLILFSAAQSTHSRIPSVSPLPRSSVRRLEKAGTRMPTVFHNAIPTPDGLLREV